MQFRPARDTQQVNHAGDSASCLSPRPAGPTQSHQPGPFPAPHTVKTDPTRFRNLGQWSFRSFGVLFPTFSKTFLRVNLSPLLLGNERPCATSDNERRAFPY